MAKFEFVTELNCSQESLFEFLRRPLNVAKISDPGLGLTFVDAPEVIDTGSTIQFQIQGYGRVQRVTHTINEVEPHDRIIEVQTDGPLREWTHQHLFRETENGTAMTDLIDFIPPGGIIGLMMTDDRILDSLEQGFFYRQQQLEKLVESGAIA